MSLSCRAFHHLPVSVRARMIGLEKQRITRIILTSFWFNFESIVIEHKCFRPFLVSKYLYYCVGHVSKSLYFDGIVKSMRRKYSRAGLGLKSSGFKGGSYPKSKINCELLILSTPDLKPSIIVTKPPYILVREFLKPLSEIHRTKHFMGAAYSITKRLQLKTWNYQATTFWQNPLPFNYGCIVLIFHCLSSSSWE